jgi:ABC-type sugar transport system substrate-binding protein
VSEVEGFISRGVSGIVLAPLDEAALAPPVAEAKRRGIPVVVIDSGLKGTTTSASSPPTIARAAARRRASRGRGA